MLVGTGYNNGAPPIVWMIFFAVLIVAGIASILQGLGAAGTGLAALKAIKSMAGGGQLLAGRPASGPLRLSGPIDLVGQSMAAAVLTDPLMIKVSAMIGMIQLARLGGGKAAPHQYVTDRLAARWGDGSLQRPPGLFSVTELHAWPLAPGPAGDRMLVWFKGRLNAGATFAEYWTFVSAGPVPVLPPQCPSCGAPTTGVTTNVCAYCNTTLWQAPAGAPSYWLVDDISSTPPTDLSAAA
jgi:hypothetical protein